jgi:pimeloyl-ACP methyl ester carboxylesterase
MARRAALPAAASFPDCRLRWAAAREILCAWRGAGIRAGWPGMPDERGGGWPRYVTGTVTSRDGTIIGYRQAGHGPGIILLHGGMQAAQNLMKLAGALADAFTVYVPDHRGRGLSGPPGEHYSIDAECADVGALARATGAVSLFGLSSGAIIALQAALVLPAIRRVAVYEPPLSVNHSTPTSWVARYDREVAAGRLGSATITAIRGTRTAPPVLRLVPRALLEVPLNRAARANANSSRARSGGQLPSRSPARQAMLRFLLWPLRKAASQNAAQDAAATGPGDVPLRELVPTMHYDAQLVTETEGRLPAFSAIPAEVLLLGGSKSPAYLKTTLDALAGILPKARHIEFAGCGHLAPDNSGQPERVAPELRAFFAAG